MAARWQGEGGQHQGGRPYQEDSWALRPLADGTLLAIVADGMGGHAGGAVASKLVVEAFVAALNRGKSLADGLQEANQAVRKGAAGKPDLAGMGSTVIAAVVKDDEVRWISVGDSPFYRVASGKLERLNADHSMAPQIDELQERGMLSAEEAAAHPGRHTLREAVMGEPLTLIDEGRQKIPTGVRLLLCSDGVQSLSDQAIAVTSGKSVADVIAAVLAVGSPHQDNVTVIKLERRP
jgi:serine/threonine protein phosphatase PrpC